MRSITLFRKTILVIIQFVIGLSLYAQSERRILQGRIVSSVDSILYPFTTIEIKGDTSKNSHIFSYAFSDSAGYFSMDLPSLPQLATFYVTIRALGYKADIIRISALERKGNIDLGNIFLYSSLVDLPSVQVKSVQKIRQFGDTTEFEADAFKKINQNSISDLLKNMPGFAIDDNTGKIIYNGKLLDRVLIEGQDLYEKNYAGLIQNISTNGIQNIQVINNRKNEETLSSAFAGTKENVLNLNYDKSKKIRVYGTLNGNIGLHTIYDVGANMISLLSKTKIVGFSSSNNIGKTENLLKGRKTIIPESDAGPIETRYSTNSPFTKPLSIANTQIPTQYYNFNNTSYTSLLGQWDYRKLSIRNKVEYVHDKNEQLSQNQQYYFVGDSITNSVMQADTSLYKKNDLKDDLKLHYKISDKQEIIYAFSLGLGKYRSLVHENINNIVNDNITKYKISDWRQSISYNLLLSKEDLLSAFVIYGIEKIPEEFQFGPQIGIDNHSEPYSFYQKIKSNANSQSYSLRYTKKQALQSFYIEIGHVHMKSPINGQSFYRQLFKDTAFTPLTDFMSNTYSNQNNFVKGNYSLFFLHKKMNLTLSPLITKEERKWNRINDSKVQKLIVNSNIGIEYKITDKKIVSLNYNSSVAPIPFASIYPGNFFETNTSLLSGNDSILIKNQYNTHIFYSDVDILRKKRIFFISYIFQKNPVYYLSNLRNNGIYNLQNAVASNRNNIFHSLSFQYDKALTGINARLIFSDNMSYMKNYTMLNTTLQLNKIYSNNAEIQYKTDLLPWLHVDFSSGWKYSLQKINVEKHLTRNIFTEKIATEIKPNEKLLLVINYQLLQNSTDFGQNSKSNFLDLNIYYAISKKLKLYLMGENMLDNQSFVSNFVTSYSYSYNYIKLRRVILAGFNLQL